LEQITWWGTWSRSFLYTSNLEGMFQITEPGCRDGDLNRAYEQCGVAAMACALLIGFKVKVLTTHKREATRLVMPR
jgi:hypothetical protein